MPSNGSSRAASPPRWCSTATAARRCPPIRPVREICPPAPPTRSPPGTTTATDASRARRRGATASRPCGAAIRPTPSCATGTRRGGLRMRPGAAATPDRLAAFADASEGRPGVVRWRHSRESPRTRSRCTGANPALHRVHHSLPGAMSLARNRRAKPEGKRQRTPRSGSAKGKRVETGSRSVPTALPRFLARLLSTDVFARTQYRTFPPRSASSQDRPAEDQRAGCTSGLDSSSSLSSSSGSSRSSAPISIIRAISVFQNRSEIIPSSRSFFKGV